MARSRRQVPPLESPDLRARILEASVGLIEGEGLSALSMREVARRAGVSHQAPYHHFADRESILAAVAQEGFLRLTAALEAAGGSAKTAAERMTAGGRAYVAFARAHPAHFKVMFRPELVELSGHPSAHEAAGRAFAALESMVGGLAGAGHVSKAEAPATVLLAWSIVHGLASLAVDGPLEEEDEATLVANIEGALSMFSRLLRRPRSRRASGTKPRR